MTRPYARPSTLVSVVSAAARAGDPSDRKTLSAAAKAARNNEFAGKSFAELSHVAGKMIRGEYDYAGRDCNTHFMDLTEVLMSEHHDRTRDDLMRETIRGLVGRLQVAHGYGPGGGVE